MASFPATNARSWQRAHEAMLLCAAVSLCGAGLVFSFQRSPAAAQMLNDELDSMRGSQAQSAAPAPVSVVEKMRSASPGAPDVSPVPDFYLPFVPPAQASPAETSLLKATNAARADEGLAPLVPDDGLNQLARIRARQLADQGYFGHVDPEGYTMYTELLTLTGSSYNWAGENLALNDSPMSESPASAFAALMQSPDHRENILAADYARVGIGELTTPDGRHIYAMIFVG